MSSASGGGETFKDRDAHSYDDVAESFERLTARFTRPLAERLVAFGDLAPGHSVLDVGCGTGVVTLEAARAVGPTGEVVGADLSDGMLAVAARRAAESGLADRVRWQREDAEALTCGDASFDRVVSLYALLHFPHPERAVAEMARVLRPGGRLVLAIGRPPPFASPAGLAYLLRRLPLVVQERRGRWLAAPAFHDRLVEEHVPRRGEAEQSHLAHGHGAPAAAAADMVRRAGLVDVATAWEARAESIPDVDDFWEVGATFSSLARKRLADATEEERAAVREAFERRCRDVLARGGRLVYPYTATFIRGTRPGS